VPYRRERSQRKVNREMQSYRTLQVRLRPETSEQLVERAAQERRRPQDQAAIIIERALGAVADGAAPDEARSVGLKVQA
jgi:hypothetical protein